MDFCLKYLFLKIRKLRKIYFFTAIDWSLKKKRKFVEIFIQFNTKHLLNNPQNFCWYKIRFNYNKYIKTDKQINTAGKIENSKQTLKKSTNEKKIDKMKIFLNNGSSNRQKQIISYSK